MRIANIHASNRRPREGGDPVTLSRKTPDPRLRGNDEFGWAAYGREH
jgi:hypothetical protein